MENPTKSQLKLSSIVEKKYKCPSCYYSSDNLYIVRQHLVTHYIKPEVCPYCQEVPTTKYHRKTLYRKDISRFTSKECSVLFSKSSEKCGIVFTARYVCDLCGNHFKCILSSKSDKKPVVMIKGPGENKVSVKAIKNESESLCVKAIKNESESL